MLICILNHLAQSFGGRLKFESCRSLDFIQQTVKPRLGDNHSKVEHYVLENLPNITSIEESVISS